MGKIGMWELLIIGGIALFIFGPKQLPKFGQSIAETIRSFKRAGRELTQPIEDEVKL
jgi:TatA/E family protein of Tat protein translocase